MATILDPSLYTIVWIAVLPIEAEAALGMLDRLHTGHFLTNPGEDYLYLPGEINHHNVVIATWPAGQNYGVGSAAALANQIKVKFQKIWFALLVGVAAGVPNLTDQDPARRRDVRLGDVLVVVPEQTSTGIVQYDLGRHTEQGFFPNSRQCETPAIVRAAIGQIRLMNKRPFESGGKFAQTLLEFQSRPGNGSFAFPGQERDELYAYKSSPGSATSAQRVKRSVREDAELTRVWYGALGSGNSLMRNPRKRDWLRDKYNIIGLEMEAAGVVNTLPTAVVRGVCDYGDETKNKLWQPYAAATAAVYARGILYTIHTGTVPSSSDLDALQSPVSIPVVDEAKLSVPTAASRAGSKGLHQSTNTIKPSLTVKQNDQSTCKASGISLLDQDKHDRSQEDVLRSLQQQQKALGKSVAEIQKILQSYLQPVLDHDNSTSRPLGDGMSKLPRGLQSSNSLVDSGEVDFRVKTLLSWIELDELSMLAACEEGLGRRLQRRAILRPHQAKVWNFPKLQRWNSSTTSSILVLNAESMMRVDLVDFSVQAIQVLRQDGIPVIWGLEQPMIDQGEGVRYRRVLASLVSQIIRLSGFQHREREFRRICRRLQVAETEQDWLALLTKLLENLSGIHIILDAKLLVSSKAEACATATWMKLLGKVLEQLRSRGCDTVVKVLLLSCNDLVEEMSDSKHYQISTLSLTRTSHKTIPISARRSIKAGLSNRLPERFATRAGKTTARRR